MIAAYTRVSTTEQAKEGYSIGEQQQRLKDYCKARGWGAPRLFTDPGYSGGNTNRPALQELLREVKRGNVEKVIVYKLDRLSRSQKDTLELIEDYFLPNNVDFVSMSENFDTGTPIGKAFLGLLAVFAQLEREQIRERMDMGREGRAKKGKFHGSNRIPIGYNYIDGRLVIDEFEAMQVRKIFEMYLEGKSTRKIADYLNNHGFVHKYGKWYQATVFTCLKRPVYIGKIVHNGKIFDGEHEPIIAQDIFDRAAVLRQHNSEEYTKHNMRRGKVTSYLGGYLYCAKCGAKMSKQRKINNGHAYNKYICYSRWGGMPSLVKDPNCKNKIWKMENLDTLVFNEIKKLAFEPYKLEASRNDDRPEVIRNEIEKIDKQLEKVLDLYAVGDMPVNVLQSKVHTLSEQKEKLENELAELEDEENRKLSQAQTRELIESFADVLDNGDFDQIRTVIGALIDRIEIDDENITIHWAFV